MSVGTGNNGGNDPMSKETNSGELVRALDWKGAFWVAAGVPPLVLFSIGGIAGTTDAARGVSARIAAVANAAAQADTTSAKLAEMSKEVSRGAAALNDAIDAALTRAA